MASWWIGVVLLCGSTLGCDKVLGLHDRDGTSATVTGTFLLRSIENDGAGSPQVIESAFALSEIRATARLDDGSTPEVALRDDGSFSFVMPTAGQTYTLTFRTPYATSTYQLANEHVDLVERLAGRRDRAAVPPGTRLAPSLTNRPGAPAIVIEVLTSTGLWTLTAIQAGPIDLDWTRAGSMSGPIGLLDGDDVRYVAYSSASSSAGSYLTLAYAATMPDVSMLAGQTTAVSSVAVPVVKDRCVHLVAEGMTESQRLVAAAPRASPSSNLAWGVYAVPDNDFALALGFPFPIAYPNVGGPPPNVDVTIPFANPFPGHSNVAIMRLSALHGIGSLYLVSESGLIAQIPEGCASPVVLPSGTVQLPMNIAVNGTVLAVDDQPVDIVDRGADLSITWTPTSGRADFWIVTLFEVGGSNALVQRSLIVTTTTAAAFEPDLFVANQRYAVEVRAVLGFPNAASGDFRTSALPQGTTAVQVTFKLP